MELLRLKERIEIAIEMGESHFREFKSGFEGSDGSKIMRPVKSICQNIAKTLVAFANADGGELLVGVEDDGKITGLDHKEDLLKAILSAPKNYVHVSTPLPTTKAAIVDMDGLKVAYFSIPKGAEYVYITIDGKCLKKKDLESIPVAPESIQFENAEKTSREYDRMFVDGANITDLDIDLVRTTANEFSKTISTEKFLQHLDLAEFDGDKLRLRKATLLLFAKEPHKWHPRLQVRVIKIKGTELKSGSDFNAISDEEVSDNILNLIEKSWDILRPHLTETKFSEGALFKSQIIYPELACREALINAIAHRDYSIEGRGIEIFIYDDRLEIKSPGMLLSSINIEDLKRQAGVHQSRNANIARVLREVGYMRELGEGLRRIYELMEKNDLTPPELISRDKSFKTILSQKLVYSAEEKLWLDNFKNIDLSREEKTVVRLGASGELISPKLIWETVGIIDTDVYRQLIESLRFKNILISEISRLGAHKIARKERIDKKAVSRFKITVPKLKKSELKKKTENKKVKQEPFDISDYAKIYIENIPFDVSVSEIEQTFEKYGSISSVYIPKSYYSGKGRGFAFIEFEDKSSLTATFQDKFNIYLRGRKVIVKNYNRNIQRTTSNKLH